jgi:hypothetical protein
MRTYLRTHPSQMLKSWYAFFFQLPGLPERVARANNWRFLISAMPDDLDENERDRYRQAWAQPGAITGMINWYRAMLRQSRGATEPSKIQVPTLVLWGQQDPHISYQMAPLSVERCADGHLVTSRRATVPQGIAMGLSNSFVSLGRIVGPILGGAVLDIHLSLPYISSAVIMFIGFLASLIWISQNSCRDCDQGCSLGGGPTI